ncbi:MAG: hypothetical protein KAW19_08240 [Candidatus Aminicenantes bacterium]|nr:hypothetical protein [Candidatus Aminicenantes bacterium]
MTKKVDDILRIIGEEERLEGDESDQSEEGIKTTRDLPAEKLEEKKAEKKSFFISTSGPRPPKKKSKMITTRDLDADGKLIQKKEKKND